MIGRLKIVKVSIFPKWNYRFNAISVNIPEAVPLKCNKPIQNLRGNEKDR